MANDKNGINPLGAAIVGAAVGAAAVALSNKDTRDKVRIEVEKARSEAGKKVEEFQSQIQKVRHLGEKTVEDTNQEVDKKLTHAKKQVDSKTEKS